MKSNYKFGIWVAIAIVLGLLVGYSIVQVTLPLRASVTSPTSGQALNNLFANMQVGLDVNVYASPTNHTLLASRHLPHDIITNNFINLLGGFLTPTTGTAYFPMRDASGTTDYFTAWTTGVPCGGYNIQSLWCYMNPSGTSPFPTVELGVGGLNAPAGVVEYVPITLTNNQNVSTEGNTVVNLNVNWTKYSSYLASNVQNVVFYDKYGYQLAAWCESGCTSASTSSLIWVNMGHDIIPAFGGTQTIYLGFMSVSTNNFCNPNCATGYWGEYPQATHIYGQYDNGANVFQAYWNFAGTYLPSGVNYISYSGNTVLVNNGVTLQSSTFNTNGQYALYIFGFPISNIGTNILSPYNYATDFNGTLADCSTNTGSGNSFMGYFYDTNNLQYPTYTGSFNVESLNGPSTGSAPVSSYGAINTAGTYPFHQYNHGIWTSLEGSNYVYYYNNYTTLAGQTTIAQSPNQLYYWGLSLMPNAGQTSCAPNGDFMQWLRQRVAPPYNVMPSASFGTATSGTGVVTIEPAVARTDYALYNQYGGYMVPNQPATYNGNNIVSVSASQVATSSASISEAGLFIVAGMDYGTSVNNVLTLGRLPPNFVPVLMFHDNFTAISFASGNFISVTYNLILPSGSTNNFGNFMAALLTSASAAGGDVCASEQTVSFGSKCYVLWWSSTSNADCGQGNTGTPNLGCSFELTSGFPSVVGAIGTSNTPFVPSQYQLGAQIGSYNAMVYTQLSSTIFELSSTWTYTSAETYQEFGLFINSAGFNNEPSAGYGLMFFRIVYTGVPVVANGGITEAFVISF